MFAIVFAFLKSLRTNHVIYLVAGTILQGAIFWQANGGPTATIPKSVPLAGGMGVVALIILVGSLLTGTPLAPGSPVGNLLEARKRAKAQQRDTPVEHP